MNGSKRIRAEDVLKTALKTLAERGEQRGKANGERAMARTVQIFHAIAGYNLAERRGWEFMLALKLARAAQGVEFNLDDYVDLINYVALLAEHRAGVETVFDDDPAPIEPAPEGYTGGTHTCWHCECIFDKNTNEICPECGTHWTYSGL